VYDPPAYLWAITIAGPAGIAAATCIVLYGGAERAGLGRRRAALLAGAAAVLLGGWFTATALIADQGWYRTLPWYPVAAAGFLGLLLAFVLDRSDERGPAVPLMGPADHGSASPLMGPAAEGTVTPLLGPADRGTMVPLMGPADPGTATPLMLPSR